MTPEQLLILLSHVTAKGRVILKDEVKGVDDA